MKNQYVCDIGDFGKYLLLHYIIHPENDNNSLSLGINWYLTPNDDKSDGNKVGYLEHDKNHLIESLPPLSNKIYKLLKEISTRRAIDQIENKDLLPATTYYSKPVDKNNRSIWLNNSITTLSKSDIIFLDPDNGIAFNEKRKDLSKYVTCDDLKEYLEKTSSDLVLYQHGPRYKGGLVSFSKEKIFPYIKNLIRDLSIRILWYHKGTARLYVFIIRKNKYLINNRIDLFKKNHKNNLFSEIIL